MTAARVPEWPEVMVATLEQLRRQPFEFGSHDCWTFAVTVAAAITGTAPGVAYGAPYWWTYRNCLEAAAIVRRSSMAAVGDASFGERVPVLCARRGDIALVPSGHDSEAFPEAFGVVDQGEVICLASGGGYVGVPLARASVVWRIG